MTTDEKIERLFSKKEIITTNDLVTLYRQEDNTIPKPTINWRIHQLVKKNILQRVSQGKFQKGTKEKFHPLISPVVKHVNENLRKNFVYLAYCVWDNEMLNPYHQHLPGARITLIDVEKDAMESVYHHLQDKYKNLYLKFSKHAIHQPVLPPNDSLVIRQLITEAPIEYVEEVPTVSIEKLIVDAYADPEFEYLQGNEYQIVASNIFEQMVVNKGRLLRYASRKGKKEEMQQLLANNNVLLDI